MTQLDMITDAIEKLEATVENDKAPFAKTSQVTSAGKSADQPQQSDLAMPQAGPTMTATTKAPRNRMAAKLTSIRTQPPRAKAPRSKKAMLLGLMERKHGATMQALMNSTGWQAHSVRAGLSGLRKDGFGLERRTNRKGETVYSVIQNEASQ